MALENFDWDRAYLARHNIHHVFEDCVEDLVIQRPQTKAAITSCIVSRIRAVRDAKQKPAKRVFFCIGQQDIAPFATALAAVAEDGVASATEVIAVDAKSVDIAKLVTDVSGSVAKNVFLVGFPLTITQAVNFEAAFGQAHQTLLFVTSTGYETDKDYLPVAAGPVRTAYFKDVNPVAQHYRAIGRLSVVLTDKGTQEQVEKLLAS